MFKKVCMARYQQEFSEQFQLTEKQQHQFALYAQLLVEHNQKYNLTAITDLQAIYMHHFADSLMLTQCADKLPSQGIIDVGSGGGFPALPLAIFYPEVPVHCVEVIAKKQNFLRHVADELGLDNVRVHGQDWRTFLRTVHVPADVVTARASLQVPELLRVFKPSSLYKKVTLYYWASGLWQPEVKTQPYMQDEYWYNSGDKKRRLVRMCAFAK